MTVRERLIAFVNPFITDDEASAAAIKGMMIDYNLQEDADYNKAEHEATVKLAAIDLLTTARPVKLMSEGDLTITYDTDLNKRIDFLKGIIGGFRTVRSLNIK